MKLSKPSEDTLKGLAKLLKDLKGNDTNIMVAGTSQVNDALTKQVIALEKDLRQLRKSLAEMPVPVTVGEVKGEVYPEFDKEKVNALPVLNVEHESLKLIHEAYVNTFGPLPEAMDAGDITVSVVEIIQRSKTGLDPVQAAIAEAEANGQDGYLAGMGAKLNQKLAAENMTVTGHLYVTGDVVFQAVPDTDLKEGDMMVKGDLFITGNINLPEPQRGENPCAEIVLPTPQTCLAGMLVMEDKPALFANPVQLDNGAMLIGVRKVEEGVFTEPLYRKPK